MPKGIPVVITDNGAPFVPVASGSPVATVSTNGFGTPVTLVAHNAPPLIVEGLVPLEEPIPFTLYAGSLSGGDVGYYTTIGGSISTEPMPGFPLIEMASRNSGYFQVAFRGNILANMTGLEPVVSAVTLGNFIFPWAYDADDNITSATWESTGALLTNVEYSVTWSNGL